MEVIEWPPEYTIKRHRRAKHVKLLYTHHGGLQITMPHRFSVKQLPSILEEHKEWILQQKIKHDRPSAYVKPQDINLQAIQQKWIVHYFQNDKRPRVKQFAANEIILSGDIREFAVCREKLSNWVKKQAHLHLTSYFKHLAREIGMPFLDVSVRSQATLWGSCSQDKSIRLNFKLIFLPVELMRHIMIHELCHTIHMNHSQKFWDLVAKYDVNWKIHKREMRTADKFIPAWIQLRD